MNATDLKLHDYYLIGATRFRYMGRNKNNQYSFYSRTLDRVLLDDTEIFMCDIRACCPEPENKLIAGHETQL